MELPEIPKVCVGCRHMRYDGFGPWCAHFNSGFNLPEEDETCEERSAIMGGEGEG